MGNPQSDNVKVGAQDHDDIGGHLQYILQQESNTRFKNVTADENLQAVQAYLPDHLIDLTSFELQQKGDAI